MRGDFAEEAFIDKLLGQFAQAVQFVDIDINWSGSPDFRSKL